MTKTPVTPAAEPTVAPATDEAADVVVSTESADDRWKSVLIVAKGSVPANSRRPVIVVQSQEREEAPENDRPHRDGNMPPIKDKTYPKGADLYFHVDPVNFGEERTPVVGLGQGAGAVQVGFHGFSEKLGTVHVGPGDAVYAAANYAFTKGATKIEIVGLTAEQIEALRPWFATVKQDVDIVFG